MKWKIKQDNPKDGDVRTRRIFAWRKTRVKDYWVWLETYEVTEKYFVSAGGNQSWWSETERNTLHFYY